MHLTDSLYDVDHELCYGVVIIILSPFSASSIKSVNRFKSRRVKAMCNLILYLCIVSGVLIHEL
jgi:hypothetical protein